MMFRCVALLVLLSIPLCTSAQFAIGAKAGLVVSDMRFLGADYASTTGLSAGLSLNLPLSERVSFQPEVNFVQKGFTVTVPALDNNGSIRLDGAASETEIGLAYIEVPLLLKYDFQDADLRPFAVLGLSPSLLVQESQFTRSGPQPSIGRDFRSFDMGVVVGSGVDFRVDQLVLGFDLRYTFGLIDQIDGIRSQNRTLQILGGISLLID